MSGIAAEIKGSNPGVGKGGVHAVQKRRDGAVLAAAGDGDGDGVVVCASRRLAWLDGGELKFLCGGQVGDHRQTLIDRANSLKAQGTFDERLLDSGEFAAKAGECFDKIIRFLSLLAEIALPLDTLGLAVDDRLNAEQVDDERHREADGKADRVDLQEVVAVVGGQVHSGSFKRLQLQRGGDGDSPGFAITFTEQASDAERNGFAASEGGDLGFDECDTVEQAGLFKSKDVSRYRSL